MDSSTGPRDERLGTHGTVSEPANLRKTESLLERASPLPDATMGRARIRPWIWACTALVGIGIWYGIYLLV